MKKMDKIEACDTNTMKPQKVKICATGCNKRFNNMRGFGLFAGLIAGALALAGIFIGAFYSIKKGNAIETTAAITPLSMASTAYYETYSNSDASGSGGETTTIEYNPNIGVSDGGKKITYSYYDNQDIFSTAGSGIEESTVMSTLYNKLVTVMTDRTRMVETETSTTAAVFTTPVSTTTSSTTTISTPETTKSKATTTTIPTTTSTTPISSTTSSATPISTTTSPPISTTSASTTQKAYSPCNYFYNSTLCYWADLRYTWDTSFAEGEQICKSQQSEIAQIYNEEIYEGVMNYIRSEMPKSYTRVWIGLSAEKFGTVELYTRWYPGSSRSRSKDATNVILDVDQDPDFYYQGMRKASPSSDFPGVVCQVKTEE